MKQKKITFDLQFKVREYLEYFWKEQMQTNSQLETEIINNLSFALKDQLQLQANKIVLQESSIFKGNFSKNFLKTCVHIIKNVRLQPKQVIEKQIDNQNIYFIEKGSVEHYIEVKKQNQKDHQIIKVLKSGDCFNFESFFSGITINQSIKSSEFTKILMIQRNDFLELLKDYPKDYEKFCYIKDQMIYNHNFSIIGAQCKSCGSSDHNIYNCNLIHLQMDPVKILKIHNQDQGLQERQKYSKRTKKRNKIWVNFTYNVEKGLICFNDNQQYLEHQSWLLSNPSSFEMTDLDESSISESSYDSSETDTFTEDEQEQDSYSNSLYQVNEDEEDEYELQKSPSQSISNVSSKHKLQKSRNSFKNKKNSHSNLDLSEDLDFVEETQTSSKKQKRKNSNKQYNFSKAIKNQNLEEELRLKQLKQKFDNYRPSRNSKRHSTGIAFTPNSPLKPQLAKQKQMSVSLHPSQQENQGNIKLEKLINKQKKSSKEFLNIDETKKPYLKKEKSVKSKKRKSKSSKSKIEITVSQNTSSSSNSISSSSGEETLGQISMETSKQVVQFGAFKNKKQSIRVSEPPQINVQKTDEIFSDEEPILSSSSQKQPGERTKPSSSPNKPIVRQKSKSKQFFDENQNNNNTVKKQSFQINGEQISPKRKSKRHSTQNLSLKIPSFQNIPQSQQSPQRNYNGGFTHRHSSKTNIPSQHISHQKRGSIRESGNLLGIAQNTMNFSKQAAITIKNNINERKKSILQTPMQTLNQLNVVNNSPMMGSSVRTNRSKQNSVCTAKEENKTHFANLPPGIDILTHMNNIIEESEHIKAKQNKNQNQQKQILKKGQNSTQDIIFQQAKIIQNLMSQQAGQTNLKVPVSPSHKDENAINGILNNLLDQNLDYSENNIDENISKLLDLDRIQTLKIYYPHQNFEKILPKYEMYLENLKQNAKQSNQKRKHTKGRQTPTRKSRLLSGGNLSQNAQQQNGLKKKNSLFRDLQTHKSQIIKPKPNKFQINQTSNSVTHITSDDEQQTDRQFIPNSNFNQPTTPITQNVSQTNTVFIKNGSQDESDNIQSYNISFNQSNNQSNNQSIINNANEDKKNQ